jgi:glycerol-3-phosphate dehydrogenase (NAD(P)+)
MGQMQRIGVVGGGAWGTALATVARRAGRDVTLWAREAEVVDAIVRHHENAPFLPGVKLDRAIRATDNLMTAVDGADAIVLATPAQHSRAVAEEIAPLVTPEMPVVICAKGIEAGTLMLMSEVMAEALPGRPAAVLSGPTFAGEVARGLPTAVTLAAPTRVLGEDLIAALGTPRFRTYWSPDLVGAQIGGAVKNVLAIACGIVAGRGLGDSARAALITRGMAEMIRLGAAKGAHAETLMGLSGMGDLVLTCTSAQSRNTTLGMALAKGETLDDILGSRRSVAEGVSSAESVVGLARRFGIEMPICEAVHDVLYAGVAIDDAIDALLSRPYKPEPPHA